MIIDIHTHIMPPDIIAHREAYIEREPWFAQLYSNPQARLATAEDLVASMHRAGVDRSVALGFSFTDLGLCRACNDYVLDAAARYAQEIIPFAIVNPCAGQAALNEAQRCLNQGALGLGELVLDAFGLALDDQPMLAPFCALSASAQSPIMLHVAEQVGHRYPGKGRQGPEQAYRLAAQNPDTRFILAHWGGGLLFYELMPEVCETLRNVYYDTAASLFLYDDAIFGHTAGWAADKIIFGSDYPLIGQQRFLRRVHAAIKDPQQRALILHENAARLLLNPSDHPSLSRS